MSRRAVIGWDDTDASRRAADWAADRAVLIGEPVVLVRVVGPGAAGSDDAALVRAVDSTEDEVTRLRQSHPELAVGSEVLVGEVLPELRSFSDDDCLLVVGTNELGSPTRTSGWSLGSRLAASCNGPVAVIPGAPRSGRHGIVLGIEAADTDEAAEALAAREAVARQEPLHLVHTWHRPSEAGVKGVNPEFTAWLREAHVAVLADAAERILHDFPEVSVQQHLAEGLPTDALHGFAGSATALVVGTRGHGAVLRRLLGSTSHHLLLFIDSPTIVVPRRTGAS